MADLHGSGGKGWIGVDLDGTLAFYDGWKGPKHIGDPVPKMLKRVREWVANGHEVRIVTARVAPGKGDEDECGAAIRAWLAKYELGDLQVTHTKDHRMIELWDDRVVQVIPNTGERVDAKQEYVLLKKPLTFEEVHSLWKASPIGRVSGVVRESLEDLTGLGPYRSLRQYLSERLVGCEGLAWVSCHVVGGDSEYVHVRVSGSPFGALEAALLDFSDRAAEKEATSAK